MIVGYGIIAVPTGIVTVELGKERATSMAETLAGAPVQAVTVQLSTCPRCGLSEHDTDASYCKWCGEPLLVEARPTT